MMDNRIKIVYLGTPDFAVEPLKKLIENQGNDANCGYNVVGVVTMPDKIIERRGAQVLMSPVKEYALKHDIKLLQPTSLKDESFIAELAGLKADLQIVVAFRMLPLSVWDMPRLGTFNLHASLLPQYRGAAPINWAIINGETETGNTTFFLKHEIDTGDVVLQERIPITEDDNAGTLHDKLMYLGGDMVFQTVKSIITTDIKAIPQDDFSSSLNDLKPAPKIFKDTCRIQWNKTTVELYNFVRGLSPHPSAWTSFEDTKRGVTVDFKIFECSKEIETHSYRCGSIVTDNKSYIRVATSDGFLNLISIQLSGKKRMAIAELLRGFKFSEDASFL